MGETGCLHCSGSCIGALAWGPCLHNASCCDTSCPHSTRCSPAISGGKKMFCTGGVRPIALHSYYPCPATNLDGPDVLHAAYKAPTQQHQQQQIQPPGSPLVQPSMCTRKHMLRCSLAPSDAVCVRVSPCLCHMTVKGNKLSWGLILLLSWTGTEHPPALHAMIAMHT